MRPAFFKIIIIIGLTGAVLFWAGDIPFTGQCLIGEAQARLARPATPVSYAGVARRTTVRVATPGVGAPGVGVTPGVGVGAPGVGAAPRNAGGPVNRVGVR